MNFRFEIRTISLLILLTTALLMTGSFVTAQSDSLKFKEDLFDEFSKASNATFDAFRNQTDSVFADFLFNSWKTYDMHFNEKPFVPKPLTQPVLDSSKLMAPKASPVSNAGGAFKPGKAETSSVNRVFYESIALETETQYSDRILTEISKEGIQDYFERISENKTVASLIVELNRLSEEMSLNDWGKLILYRDFAGILFEYDADRVLFSWYVLLQNKVNAKVGFDDQRIYLLIPSQDEIYNTYTFELEGKPFYVADVFSDIKTIKRLHIHQADYPGTIEPFCLTLDKTPQFTANPGEVSLSYHQKDYDIELNQSLIRFFNEYPYCKLRVYFNSATDTALLKHMDAILLPTLQTMDKRQKIDFLLEFVQALPYATDEEQFGKEKYMFAEECVYYQTSDCEDRAVFLSKLLKRYVDVDCIGLDYPGHISLAVDPGFKVDGDYIRYNGRKYYFCDPTYIGAGLGMGIPALSELNPKIIELF